jgi:hypothetical protein
MPPVSLSRLLSSCLEAVELKVPIFWVIEIDSRARCRAHLFVGLALLLLGPCECFARKASVAVGLDGRYEHIVREFYSAGIVSVFADERRGPGGALRRLAPKGEKLLELVESEKGSDEVVARTPEVVALAVEVFPERLGRASRIWSRISNAFRLTSSREFRRLVLRISQGNGKSARERVGSRGRKRCAR